MNNHNDPNDPSEEPTPLDVWRMIFRWVSDPAHANSITAIATVAICLTGIFYTVFAGKQWQATQKAANAAKVSADTAARQLEVSERPWIQLVKMTPLSFTFYKANYQEQISFSFELRNSGNSPAVSTQIATGAIDVPVVWHTIDPFASYRNRLCKQATDGVDKDPMGLTIFPSTSTGTLRYSVSLNKEDLKKVEDHWDGFHNKILKPSVVLCVAYRSTFNKRTRYLTAYTMGLYHPFTKGNPPDSFDIGKDFPGNQLLFRPAMQNAVEAY